MSDLSEKEQTKQSDYAPSTVSSEEHLIRAIYSPEYGRELRIASTAT
jgi:hypothetical protein